MTCILNIPVEWVQLMLTVKNPRSIKLPTTFSSNVISIFEGGAKVEPTQEQC